MEHHTKRLERLERLEKKIKEKDLNKDLGSIVLRRNTLNRIIKELIANLGRESLKFQVARPAEDKQMTKFDWWQMFFGLNFALLFCIAPWPVLLGWEMTNLEKMVRALGIFLVFVGIAYWLRVYYRVTVNDAWGGWREETL